MGFVAHLRNAFTKSGKEIDTINISQNESNKVVQRLECYPLIDESNGRTAANTLGSLELLLKL